MAWTSRALSGLIAVLAIGSSALGAEGMAPRPGEEASYEWYRAQFPDPVIFTPIGPPADPAETGVSPRGQLMMGKLAYSEEDGTIPGTPYVADSLAFGLLEGGRFIPVGSGERARQSLVEGRLPIVLTEWKHGGLEFRQTSYSRPLRGEDYETGLEATLAWAVFDLVATGEAKEIAFVAAQMGDEKNPRKGLAWREGVVFEGESALFTAKAPAGFVAEFQEMIAPEAKDGVEVLRTGGAYNALVLRGRVEAGKTVRIAVCRVLQFPGTRHWGPSPAKVEPAELVQRSAEKDLEKALATWQSMHGRTRRFITPDEMLNRIVEKGMLDGYYLTKRWNGRSIVFDSVCYRCQWDDASAKWFYALDLMGDHETSERLLDTVFARQGQRRPKGAASSQGCFSDVTNITRDGSDAAWASCNGWALWAMAEHARLTNNREWLTEHRDPIIDGCDWITRERKRSMEEPGNPCAGLIHGKFVCDMPDDGPVKGVGYFTYTDAISYLGLHRMGSLLEEWGHMEGRRLREEAEAYRKDIIAAVDRAIDKSRDPWFVPWALHAPRVEHTYLNGVCGPINLAFAGVLPRDDERIAHAIRWNIDHTHGGSVERSAIASMFYSQDLAIVLLEQGRVEEFLRMLYCILGANVTHETLATCEWRRNTQPHIHSISSLVRMVRTMLVQERDGGLYLLQGTPRRWMERGSQIRIDEAPTWYGRVSLSCSAGEDAVRIKLKVPERIGTRPIHIGLRLPAGTTVAGVEARRADGQAVQAELVRGERMWVVLRRAEGEVALTVRTAR